jgi:hypothetical protein
MEPSQQQKFEQSKFEKSNDVQPAARRVAVANPHAIQRPNNPGRTVEGDRDNLIMKPPIGDQGRHTSPVGLG